MEKMDHNAHSVYLMYYHLVMVVKYRRKVMDDPISERAKEIWEYIAPDYGITLEEWNHDVDHVHVMFRAQPKSELSKFINAYKSASSRLLKKEFPQIREKLCNDGEPIREDQMERIWDSFYTSSKKKNPSAEGGKNIGLGLFVVRKIVEKHKGSCGVENRSEGVAFWIRLPMLKEGQ